MARSTLPKSALRKSSDTGSYGFCVQLLSSHFHPLHTKNEILSYKRHGVEAKIMENESAVLGGTYEELLIGMKENFTLRKKIW